LVLAGVVVVVVLLGLESIGVGSLDQEVVLESSQVVKQVSFCAETIDEETRRRAEATTDTRMFSWRRPPTITGERFAAPVKFTSRSGFLHHTIHHPAHLIVQAEFADGTRACRVVDLPRALGKEPVFVRFP
jgi:hypothetical protein